MRLPGGQLLAMNFPRSAPEWSFDRATYRNVYPGIDLIVYGNAGEAEYDWNIAPGADPTVAQFSITGGRGMRVDPSGDLVIGTEAGEVRHRSPVIYQVGTSGR